MDQPLKLVFAGTPDFAVPPLRALMASTHEVVAVYTQPDRPAGRGRRLSESPVKEVARQAGIEVRQPENFRNDADVRALAALDADLLIVVAYGLLLPRPVLDAPRLGCVNIHASLLPRWRGAAPIQRAVLEGDAESGVSIMRMEEGLDTGPVYLQLTTPITAETTGGDLHDRLSHLGAEALLEALPGIADGSLQPRPQNDALACYARKIDKAEGLIDWTRSAEAIGRQVRAFNPWPVAHTRYEDANLRIWAAQPTSGAGAAPGTVMAAGRDGVIVTTGDGLLRITRLQMPGKKPVSAADFINAHPIQGVTLG